MAHLTKQVKTIDRQEVRNQIETKLREKKVSLSSKERTAIEELFFYAIENGLSIEESFEIPSQMLDDIYERGFLLYRSGKYDEASTCFLFITLFDCNDVRSLFALAACCHKMGNYLAAISYYLSCIALEEGNPIACYHIYECYLKINEPIMAQGALLLAFNRAGENPIYAKLKEKIGLELAAIARA